MTTLDIALDVMQFVVLLVLSAANGVIAYSVFRIQKDRNTAKLVMYVELVEEDDPKDNYNALYVQNVGLVPALNVRITAVVEEWREEHPVVTRFHDKYDAFEDHHVMLRPQEYRMYALPWEEGWGLIITTIVSCSNGSGDSLYFMMGDDHGAMRQVVSKKETKRAIKKLESGKSLRRQGPKAFRMTMNLTSLGHYYELFGDKAESP